MSRFLRVGVCLAVALLPLLLGSGAEAEKRSDDPARQIQLDVVIARVERAKAPALLLEGRRTVHLKVHATPQRATKPFAAVVADASGHLASLKLLESKGMAKILAQPRLVTMSGRQASLVDGDEQMVPVPEGGGSVGVQFEVIGTTLNVLPTVMSDGRIRLEVGADITPLSLGKNAAKVNTTVTVEAGHTVVLGGLVEADRETELVILVTPRLDGHSITTRPCLREATTPVPTLTLTIANVRREEALIFTYDDNGNLVFECRLSAGKAVDVKSAPGKRWSAFYDAANCVSCTAPATPSAPSPSPSQVVNYKVGDAHATWLLREPTPR